MVVRRILGTVLAGVLALGGLQAAPAVADVATTRTFATDSHGLGELCLTAGEVTYSAGVITIDVDKLAPGITDVVIATGSLSGCINEITSLAWTGARSLATLTVSFAAFSQNNIVNTLASVSFPTGLTSLVIEDFAFWQNAGTPAGPNTLSSVTFPDGLESLTIGNSAFEQLAASGTNALTSVTFPAALTHLSIGNNAFHQQASGSNALTSVEFAGELTSLTVGFDAFYQYSPTGDNALNSVTFPSGLTSLTLGDQAFAQSAPSGSTALTSIQFPSTLTTLDIGDQAFSQYSTAAGGLSLRTVRFPGSLSSLTIGTEAFREQGGTTALTSVILEGIQPWTTSPTLTVGTNAFAGGAAPTWYWFGPDGTSLTDAWNGSITGLSPVPTLLGYRTLTFDVPADATGPGTWYVYPVSKGVGHVTAPQVLTRALLGVTWSVALPTATRNDYGLVGWCASALGLCLPKTVNSAYTLTVASQTLYARWSPLPPVVVSQLQGAAVGVPYTAGVATGAELDPCSVTSGELPAGLSLNGCTLSGTPTAVGSATFTVRASNSGGVSSGSLTLVVHNAPPTITTAALASGTVTVPYSAAIGISGGGTISCALVSGAVPPGLALTGCALSGTPTTAGSYPFVVMASNDGGSTSSAFSVVIAAAKKFTKIYKPTISGKAKVGRTLTAKVKTWKPTSTKTTWQWKRNGVAILGATASKYKLTSADKGAKITVTTTRSRVGHQSSSTSKSTAKVK